MAYGLSNGNVTDDVTRPPKVLWGSTVGYPIDSLASCLKCEQRQCGGKSFHTRRPTAATNRLSVSVVGASPSIAQATFVSRWLTNSAGKPVLSLCRVMGFVIDMFRSPATIHLPTGVVQQPSIQSIVQSVGPRLSAVG